MNAVAAMLADAVVLSIPLVLAAMGGVLHRRAGVINIGLEGQMLLGALIAVVAGAAAGSWIVGLLAGAASGALAGALMSLAITRAGGNEIIVGLGTNIAIQGLIGYVLIVLLGVSGTLRVSGLDPLPDWTVPGIDAVPVAGPVVAALVSGKGPLLWLAVALVPATWWVLHHTAWGVRLRATGAEVDSARALGLATLRARDLAGVIAGALAGLAGAQLPLGQVGLFNVNMTAGRGYIALAAFFFGRARPLPTAVACVVFGFFDAAQFRLQSPAFPAQLMQTIPYLAVVVALAIAAARRARTARGVSEAR